MTEESRPALGGAWRGLMWVLIWVAVLLPIVVGLWCLAIGHAGDWLLYRDATRSWLAGGAFYPAAQLAGPYLLGPGAVLYPPIVIPLLAVFAYHSVWAFVVPPIILTIWGVWRLRPSLPAWIAIAVCLNAGPTAYYAIAFGNPILWILAALTMATRWRPLAILVLLKPSLFPLAFFGANRRSWWLGAGALAIEAMAFLPLWPQWVAVLRNARGPMASIFYSLDGLPLLSVPLIAWLGRSRDLVKPVDVGHALSRARVPE